MSESDTVTAPSRLPAGTAAQAFRGSRKERSRVAGPWAYLFLFGATLLSLFPLYWVIILASHTNAEMAASTPPLVPKAW